MRERLTFLFENWREGWHFHQIITVRQRNCGPLIGKQNSSTAGIYHIFAPTWIDEPVFRQLVNILQIAITRLWINPPFIILHQIMANVHKSGPFECGSKSPNLCVSWYESCEPIICDANCRYYTPLTQQFEASFPEDRDLPHSISCISISIRYREYIRVMEKHNSNVAYYTFMHPKGILSVKLHCDVVDIVNAWRVLW